MIIAPDCFEATLLSGVTLFNLRGFSMESLILNVAAGGAGGSAFFVQLFPLLLIFVVFYLFLIRPQQKRAKEHEAKINAVQKNDEVVTAGGLMGKVIKVADDYVEVEIAPNVRVKAVKSTIANVQSRGTKAAND
jgi:preprotein translocase subunit YajC